MRSLEPDGVQRVATIIRERRRHLVSREAETGAVALLTDLWVVCERRDITDAILRQVCSLPALCVDAALAAERQRVIRGWLR